MKKIILTGLTAFCLYATQAVSQITTTIDISTGILNDPYSSYAPYPPNGWPDIPYYMPDDTWKLKKPGGNYGDVYPTTGVLNGYMSPGDSFSDIVPGHPHGVLAPFRTNYDIESFPTGYPSGNYIYRMQFQFDLKCNTVSSVDIVFNALSGTGIKRLLVNGQVYALPTYPPMSGHMNTNFIKLYDAWVHSINHPFTQYTVIPFPQKTVSIHPWDIQDGTNSVFIEIDPSRDSTGYADLAALVVDGYVEIQHSSTAIPESQVSLAGSTNYMCFGDAAGAAISVDLSNAYYPAVASGYQVDIIPVNPAGSAVYSGVAAISQGTIVYPAVTTNYDIVLTDPTTGCKTHIPYKVNVGPEIPYINGKLCGGQLTGTIEMPYPYQITIKESNNNVLYDGVPSDWYAMDVNLTTSVNSPEYEITITDPNTGCTRTINWTADDDGCRTANATGIAENKGLKNTMTITPNPSQGLFSVNFQGNISGTLSMYDISGKELNKITLKKETTEYKVDLTAYPKGIYLLKTSANGEQVTKKIIVE